MSYESFLKNIDAIITPVLLIGLDGTIKMINRAFVEAAGLSSPAPHYVGRTAEDILGKDLVKSCVDLAQKAISQKGSIKNFAFSRRSASGEKIYWDVTVTQWLVDDLSDGVLLSFKEVGRDYSQSREHRFMDAIIDGARDALLIMTGDYRLKKVNQTFLELFGGKPEDYLKHNLREFVFEFDRFQEETKKSVQGMPFHSVLRRQDNEPVNCETVARCYPASMFASSEQSGVSEVYWILELRALAEKDNRIVEVLSGKIRMLEDKVNNLHELNVHLTQQISELSVKQNQEKDSEQDNDWAENLMELSDERDRLRHAKQDAEMRLRLLQNKYNTESQAWQKDKEGILIDHQEILKEKQAVTEKAQVLSAELEQLRTEIDTLRQDFNDARDAMLRMQDENLALKAENDKLRLENDELRTDLTIARQSYQEVIASTEANQHLQDYQQSARDELDEKIRECENLSRRISELEEGIAESDAELGTARDLAARQEGVSRRLLESREAELAEQKKELEDALGLVKELQAALAESDQFLVTARQDALAQERSLAEFRQLLDEKHALQEQQRLALEEQEKIHRSDLDKVALSQKMILDEIKQKHADELADLRAEHAEELADTEQSHRAMCVEYEKTQRALADAQHYLIERQLDVPVAMSGQLLAGAVKILENSSDIFAESLSDLPTDLQGSPAVKNMLVANKDLEKLVSCLNLFDDAFLKTAPKQHALLDTYQSWQEEFTRQYPDRDLYFKYPVDGEIICHESRVLAILRDLLANAVEATSDQPDGEVKVKIQIKAPPDIPKGYFKKEPVQHCLLVQVLDNGENWFDPEQAVKPYYSSKDGHLGLGLSTVRFLLESMGGELELRSTPNGGAATFYLPLP